MGKQNTRKNNPWIRFVKATWIDMKKSNKDVKYKDAMKEAGKRYKKKGGAMYSSGVADNAAAVKGGGHLTDSADLNDDASHADENLTKASMGGRRRRRRKSTKKKSHKRGRKSRKSRRGRR